jgi:uncharacterized membrane protein
MRSEEEDRDVNVFKRDRFGSFLPPERNAMLADDVFAIVMTLLVFQFSIPVVTSKAELPGKHASKVNC